MIHTVVEVVVKDPVQFHMIKNGDTNHNSFFPPFKSLLARDLQPYLNDEIPCLPIPSVAFF